MCLVVFLGLSFFGFRLIGFFVRIYLLVLLVFFFFFFFFFFFKFLGSRRGRVLSRVQGV